MGLLDGRVAIVTGGGRALGREHCLELARHGAVVDPGVGLGGETTEENPAEAMAREIRELGGTATAELDSVTDWAAAAGIVERTVARFGRLDAVVNSAGILRDRMITSMVEEDFDAVVGVHLKGTFVMTKHACDHWRARAKAGEQVSGRIINTTSGAGMHGNAGQSAYAAAKAGVVALTLTTAIEMARYNVTCNAISPVARTRMTARLALDRPAHEGAAVDPLHPRAAAPVVAYLASEASAWLSGQVLRIEGSTVIRMRGWQPSDVRYAAADGGYLRADELVTGLRTAYGTLPAGVG